ncbi:MAG: polyphosphate kinase 2 [Myxococcota bacterium]
MTQEPGIDDDDAIDLPMESRLERPDAVELDRLQTELVRLQNRVKKNGERVVIIFEGRDTAGKGGAIFRFTRYLDPRASRVVALPKPSDRQKGEWFFQRYVVHLPTQGEIVLFDRSWYNRAVVEPVLGFCSPEEYERFMQQVPLFESMLINDGIRLIKLWFSIDKETQRRRLEMRRVDVRRQWKLSPVDGQAQERWDTVTRYKDEMYRRTHSEHAPWVIVRGTDKYRARTEAMRHVLKVLGADFPSDLRLEPDPAVVRLYVH